MSGRYHSSRRSVRRRISARRARRNFFAGLTLSALAAVILLTVFVVMHITARPASADDAPVVPRYKYYTSIQVHAGDSLWSIAGEYMTEEYRDVREYVNEVMQINGLGSENLHAGSYICVPYYSEEYK